MLVGATAPRAAAPRSILIYDGRARASVIYFPLRTQRIAYYWYVHARAAPSESRQMYNNAVRIIL